MSRLTDQVAWITGAGSGIGEAIAMALADAGAFVVLSGRREPELARVQRRIEAQRGRAEAIPLDVTSADAAQRVADTVLARHGRIGTLVNSAGVNLATRFWKHLTRESWNQIVRTNLDGTLNCIAAVLPSMRQHRDGLVVNISSWAGKYDLYITGPAFNAAKQGVVALSHSLNIEEGVNGIRCCAVCPGEVATPILRKRPTPPSEAEMAKMLQPADVGALVRFIAELPAHVCMNEVILSPTWNRIYLGGPDFDRKPSEA